MFTPNSALDRLFKFLSRVQYHYQRCFKSPDGEAVLADLAPYCYACAPCRNEREEGRRDVWLRIQQHLQMKPEELTVLFAKLGPEQRHQLFTGPSATYIQE
jgi:hypothetical protein